jgi:hypothetical protein
MSEERQEYDLTPGDVPYLKLPAGVNPIGAFMTNALQKMNEATDSATRARIDGDAPATPAGLDVMIGQDDDTVEWVQIGEYIVPLAALQKLQSAIDEMKARQAQIEQPAGAIDLAGIEQRALASTAGTFKTDERGTIYWRAENAGQDAPSVFYAEIFGPGFKEWPKNVAQCVTDATFHVHAREDVLALVAENRRLRGEIAELLPICDAQAFQISNLQSRLTMCEGAKQ